MAQVASMIWSASFQLWLVCQLWTLLDRNNLDAVTHALATSRTGLLQHVLCRAALEDDLGDFTTSKRQLLAGDPFRTHIASFKTGASVANSFLGSVQSAHARI